MSSGATDENNTSGIPLHRRELSRIERDQPVIVHYQSNRGNKKKKKRSGIVTNVQALGPETTRFWFYDSEAERKIEVTLRETLSDSSVRSQKTSTASTVGTPILVLSATDNSTVQDIEQEHLLAKRNKDFDVVVAAAAIRSNEEIVAWIRTTTE